MMLAFTPADMLSQLRSAQNRYEAEHKQLVQWEMGEGRPSDGNNNNNYTSARTQEALSSHRQLVREALEAACTAMCVGGEEFVRAIDVHPMLQVLCRVIASCDDLQTATLVLAFRALALIADTVPQANVIMAAPSRGNRVVPLLIMYLEKPHLLLSYDDLAEEILRCLSFIALIDCGASILFEYHTLAHLLALECLFTEVAYLGQLCLETAHRMLTLIHPRGANDVEPSLLQLVHNMEDTISAAFNVPSPSSATTRRTPLPSTTPTTSASQAEGDSAALDAASVAIPNTGVTVLPTDRFTRLKSYCLCLAAAFERLTPLSPTRHRELISRAFDVCARLAGYACRLQGDQRQSLLVLAVSPIANLYVAQPVDMVPFLIESALLERLVQIVLEVLASPMRAFTVCAPAVSPSAASASAAASGAVDSTGAALTPRNHPSPQRPHSQRSPRPMTSSLNASAIAGSHAASPMHPTSGQVTPRGGDNAPQHVRATPLSLNRLSDRYDAAASAALDLTDEQTVALLQSDAAENAAHTPTRRDEDEAAIDTTAPFGANTPAAAAAAAPATATSSATVEVGGPTFASRLLGHDTANLPFISEELCVLPLLELLLMLLPHTRHTRDSHFDHLNATQPYFGWQWEDDFHNRNDCAEGLGTRLEREYQKKRNEGLRKDTRTIVTHSAPRLLSVDFLGQYFTSTHGRSNRRLFRQAAVSGFAHNLLTGLHAGCQCGHIASEKARSKSKKREKQAARHGARPPRATEHEPLLSPVANPFAASTLTQLYDNPRAATTRGASRASFSMASASASTPHGALRRVGSHRRAEAAPVMDEVPSMADDGRANLEQSQLTQFLFEGSHATLDMGASWLTTADTVTTLPPPPLSVSRLSVLAPSSLTPPLPPPSTTRAALTVAETPLGQAASINPHRRADARVVVIASGAPEPTSAPAAGGRAPPAAGPASVPSAHTLRTASTNSSPTTSTSTASTPPSSTLSAEDDHGEQQSNRDMPPQPHRTTATAAATRRLDFTRDPYGRGLPTFDPSTPQSQQGLLPSVPGASPTNTSPSFSRGLMGSRGTASSPPLPASPARRTTGGGGGGGWSCCRASDTADNRIEVGGVSEQASARTVSVGSGARAARSPQSGAWSPTSRRSRGAGRGGFAAVLPPSTEKEDRRLLRDLAEELLTSPTLRQRFLQDVVMSVLLERFLPRLLTVIRNSVNPIVVRHASILLLRCLSLAGEWAEMDDTTPAPSSAHATAALAAMTKPNESFTVSLSSLQGQQATHDPDSSATHRMSLFSFSSHGSFDRSSAYPRGSKTAAAITVPSGAPPSSASRYPTRSGPSKATEKNVNPLLGGAPGVAVPVVRRRPHTEAVQHALSHSTKALAEVLVYLLSTNEADPQPLLGPYFPFRALSEDPRMLYTVMRMGLSVEFCTYVPTVRGEMRLAAADAVLHLARLERRVASAAVPVANGGDGGGSGWHVFTVAEARAVEQRAVALADLVQSDARDNHLIMGHGVPVGLGGAAIVMEQAAFAKQDSAPQKVIAAVTSTPSESCGFHHTLNAARQHFVDTLRRVGLVMAEQSQQRALNAELSTDFLLAADGSAASGTVTRLADAATTKAVWEEGGDHDTAATTSLTARTQIHSAASSLSETAPIQPSGRAQMPTENTLVQILASPSASTTATSPGPRAGGARPADGSPVGGGERSHCGHTAPFLSSVGGAPMLVVDLSEPAQLRRALESRVVLLAAEVPVCAARLPVALYHLLRESDLTMRVLVAKAPQVLNEVAQALLLWAYPRFRDRETVLATGGSLAPPPALAMLMHDAAEDRAQVSLSLNASTHHQLAQLTQELTFAVGERLGLAAGVSSHACSLPALLPVRFAKRELKNKLSATVTDLTWTPIAIHLERYVNNNTNNGGRRTSASLTYEDEVDRPTTDDARCELYIGGHVLRYLPVELDTRALLVVCTSTIGALQSLIIQHTIAPFQPPAPPPAPAAPSSTPTTGTGAGRRASVQRPPAPPPLGLSTISTDSDEEARPGANGAPHRRGRGSASATGASAAPVWVLPDPRGLPTSPNKMTTSTATGKGTAGGVGSSGVVPRTHRTPAALRSSMRLDTPLFDDAHGPYDHLMASPPPTTAPVRPTSSAAGQPVLSSHQSRSPTHRRLSTGSTGSYNGTTTTTGLCRDEAPVLQTTGEPLAAVPSSRLLLLIDGVPLLCPMTSLVDALCYYAVSGASLRDYIDADAPDETDEDNADPDDAPDGESRRSGGAGRPSAATALDENAAAHALRRLAFWITVHRVQYVLLESPLPLSLRLVHTKCGCRGGAAMYPGAPSFYCAPKHLFTMLHETKSEPSDGALRLLHALTLAGRESGASAGDGSEAFPATSSTAFSSNQFSTTATLATGLSGFTDSDATENSRSLAGRNAVLFREHRLRSALVHDLYSQLDTILLPPLMYRYLGECFDDTTVGTHLASYALWNYPLIFPFAVRMTLLDLFLGARRRMSARVIQSSARFLRSQVGPRFLGFQWMHTGQNAITINTTRIPVKVRRERLLEDGAALLRQHAFCPFQLDVHFRGEPGIGIGPALELFELMATALATPETGMWRTELDANGNRGVAPLLYPSPYPTHRSLLHFETLGLLMGRLLMLRRPASVRFHPLFLRRLLFRSAMTSTQEASRAMALLDPELERMLLSLIEMPADDLEACALTFVLPSSEPNRPEIPLCANGASVSITSANVRSYAMAVRHYHLEHCVDLALQSFRVGLQYVLNPIYLSIFTIDEISSILSGPTGKLWHTRDAFSRDVAPQHGYTRNSPMIQYLVEIVPSWTETQQRAFLRFVTGSGTLPAGGLSEPIKVVRRDAGMPNEAAAAAGPSAADDVTEDRDADNVSSGAHECESSGAALANSGSLPTASTCFHYLKLPQYASKSLLEARLLRAVEEGQTGFMLT